MTQLQTKNFHEAVFPSGLSLTRDEIFKAIFADPRDLSPLQAFLQAMLPEIPINQLRLLSTEEPASGFHQKALRYDIHALVNDTLLVDIEMQVNGSRDTLLPRLEYYGARLFTAQKARGIDYGKLMDVRILLILKNGSILKTGNIVNGINTGRITNAIEETREILTSKIQMSIIELGNASQLLSVPVEQMSARERWALLLKYATDPNQKPTIEALIAMDEGCRKAVEKLMDLYDDLIDFFKEEDLRRAEADLDSERRKKQREKEELLNQGRREGRTEGKTEGALTKVIKLTLTKWRKGMRSPAIAEDLIEEQSLIDGIIQYSQNHPDSDPEDIAAALLSL